MKRSRRLVEASPALAKAGWDWGFGDWETAHGARPDLFTLAMLGPLDVGKALTATNPGIQRIPGPLGITLLEHARSGREPSSAVVAYLEKLGNADIRATSLEVTDDLRAVYVGRNRFAPGSTERWRSWSTTRVCWPSGKASASPTY